MDYSPIAVPHKHNAFNSIFVSEFLVHYTLCNIATTTEDQMHFYMALQWFQWN